jgi:hypothetical protein
VLLLLVLVGCQLLGRAAAAAVALVILQLLLLLVLALPFAEQLA